MRLQRRAGTRGRRNKYRLSHEPLETRLALSAVATTMAMDPTASGMIGQVATAPVVVIDRSDDARCLGPAPSRQHHEAGPFRRVWPLSIRLSEPTGTYRAKIKARNGSGQVSKAAMTVTKGDAVIAWIDTMIQVVKADIANVGMASRTLAMVSGAVYDAVNDIDRTGSVYKFDVPAAPGASASAAASEAAYTVLSALDPIMEPLLEVRMAQSLAAEPSASAAAAGVNVGREVAQSMLAWRANDGSSAQSRTSLARPQASGDPPRRLTRPPGAPNGARSRHSRSQNRRPPSSPRPLPP